MHARVALPVVLVMLVPATGFDIEHPNNLTWIGVSRGDTTEECAPGEKGCPHKLHAEPFELLETEVTVASFDDCVAAGKCTKAHFDDATCSVTDSHGESRVGALPVDERGPRMPVVCVDQAAAAAFCAWAGGRLPTSDELGIVITDHSPLWSSESICASANVADASAKKKYPKFQTFACDDGYERTAPVCSFPREAPGNFCDVRGNVWEWTSTTTNGAKNVEVRGGSWDYERKSGRPYGRLSVPASTKDGSIGFRCARAATKKS